MYFRNEYKNFNTKQNLPIEEHTTKKKITEKVNNIKDVIKAGIKVKSTIPTPAGIYYEFFSVKDVEAASAIIPGTITDKTLLVKG